MSGVEPSTDFVSITALLADILLPQLLNSLTDPDQSKIPQKQSQPLNSHAGESGTERVKGHKGLHSSGQEVQGHSLCPPRCSSLANIQHHNPPCLLPGEGAESSAGARYMPPEKTAKHTDGTAQKAALSRCRKSKDHGQENTKKPKSIGLQGPELRQKRSQSFPR